MFIDTFYSKAGDQISISSEQASRFAKSIAGDFNPLHDADARRFCVPGDLIFAIILQRYGLARVMTVNFTGMIGRDKSLKLAEKIDNQAAITDANGKTYVEIEQAAEITRDAHLIQSFVKEYVAFSGQNFPYILVPLLKKHDIMFNPKSPLVMYVSMSFEFTSLVLQEPVVELVDCTLEVLGKRADARFKFAIKDQGLEVGQGEKQMVISGLQPFDDSLMQGVIDHFSALKASYAKQLGA